MKKEEILKNAGIYENFDFYEIEEHDDEYKIYNTKGDILGCILIGDSFEYINSDKYLDVANSKASMIKLLEYLKEVDAVMITIKDG